MAGPGPERPSPLRVLLFIEHFGDGHAQVARALRAEFERRSAVVEEVDCLRNSTPRFSRFNEALFNGLTRHAPFIYGWSYDCTRRLSNRSWLWQALSYAAREEAAKAIAHFAPDVVLQLFPDHTIMSVDHRGERPLTGVVLTDFSIHARWFAPGADVYYLPHQSFLGEAQKRVGQAGGAAFVPAGIPLRPEFAAGQTHAEDRRHIVVAGGGRGLFASFDQVLETVYANRNGRDVVVLCGRNAEMLRAVAERAASRPGLRGLPFVQDVSPWFRGAAYAVTKPGGVTVAECLASGCPMIFYRPSPGQEFDNARFVQRLGAGKIVTSEEELAKAAMLLGETQANQAASLAARALSHPDAAKRVVEDVLARLERRGVRCGQQAGVPLGAPGGGVGIGVGVESDIL